MLKSELELLVKSIEGKIGIVLNKVRAGNPYSRVCSICGVGPDQNHLKSCAVWPLIEWRMELHGVDGTGEEMELDYGERAKRHMA